MTPFKRALYIRVYSLLSYFNGAYNCNENKCRRHCRLFVPHFSPGMLKLFMLLGGFDLALLTLPLLLTLLALLLALLLTLFCLGLRFWWATDVGFKTSLRIALSSPWAAINGWVNTGSNDPQWETGALNDGKSSSYWEWLFRNHSATGAARWQVDGGSHAPPQDIFQSKLNQFRGDFPASR